MMANQNEVNMNRVLRNKTVSANIRRLQETVNDKLSEREKHRFVEAFHAYHADRDVVGFVRTLKTILNTGQKRQLLSYIRKVIPKVDIEVFDIYSGLSSKSYNTLPKFSHHQNLQGTINGSANSWRHSTSTLELQKPTQLNGESNPTVPTNSIGGGVYKIRLHYPRDGGFGFSIRGGAEFGTGVYISGVDNGGMAQQEGVHPGDLLLEVNSISFNSIRHEEAAKIIKSATRLDLLVSRIGRIPGSFVVHQSYKWVDSQGRPVSPPPEVERRASDDSSDDRIKSTLPLLKRSDERKVNLVVEGGNLGLMIRGGREFGLGIYVSGIDLFSVAENAGLKVGDQIIDVNGRSFLDITHGEAAKLLKSSKHMMMTIRDVGKLPHAKMKIDKTEWISKHASLLRLPVSDGEVTATQTMGFSKGAGSQLMLNSRRNWDLVDAKARNLLNDNERGTLSYYLQEYQKNLVTVEGLLLALFELLNTPAKFSLIKEIKTLVNGADLDKFDKMLLTRGKSRKGEDMHRENMLHLAISGIQDTDPAKSYLPGVNEVIMRTPVDSNSNSRSSKMNEQTKNHINDSIRNGMMLSHGKSYHAPPPPRQTIMNDTIFIKPMDQNSVHNSSVQATDAEGDLIEHSTIRRIADASIDKIYSSDNSTYRSSSLKKGSGPVKVVQIGERSKDKSHLGDWVTEEEETSYRKNEDNMLKKNRIPLNMDIDVSRPLVPKIKVRISEEKPVTINDSDCNCHEETDEDTDDTLSAIHSQEDGISTGHSVHFEVGNDMDAARVTKARDRYGNIPLVFAKIQKTKQTLGLAIEGGANTKQPLPRVLNIQPTGSAVDCEALQIGHVILEVNGRSLVGVEHKDAARLIAEAFVNKTVTFMELLVTEETTKLNDIIKNTSRL